MLNRRRIFSIIGIIISSLLIISPLIYSIFFFTAFQINITNPVGYQIIFSWIVDKIIYILLGTAGLILSIKYFKKNK